MRKVFFCGVILFIALAATAFAGRAEIEAAIGSYEAIVLEAETLAERSLLEISDFSALDERAGVAESAIIALAEEREWLIEDTRRLAVLRARLNQALATMARALLTF